MTEERVEKINKNAAVYLQEWLAGLAEGDVAEKDLLASLYAAMVTAYLYGYSPDTMAIDAKAAAARLLAMIEQSDEQENIEEVELKE